MGRGNSSRAAWLLRSLRPSAYRPRISAWSFVVTRKNPSWATALASGSWSEPTAIARPPLTACQGAYSVGRLLPVASAVWEPAPDLRTSTECWLTAGGPHHTVLSTALDAAAVDEFAELTRTELALIGPGTTPRAFRHELRWNAAYHRLAAGL